MEVLLDGKKITASLVVGTLLSLGGGLMALGGVSSGAGLGLGAGAAAARFNGRVARVAAGNNHTVCLTRDGDVFQWGGRLFIQPTHIPLATISAKALAAETSAG